MLTLSNFLKRLFLVPLLVLISGCAVLPKSLDSNEQDDGKHFQRQIVSVPSAFDHTGLNVTSAFDQFNSDTLYQARFARGDTLHIKIGGMSEYDGLYQVTAEGELDLPFGQSLEISKHTRKSLKDSIEDELVRLNWFHRESVRVDLSVVSLAPISVSVYGAVFNPGRVTINQRPALKPEEQVARESGAFSTSRNLSSAIMAAGGVRPDADLSNIVIIRDKRVLSISLSSLIYGSGFVRMPNLVDGDKIVIFSSGKINTSLIRPSEITPPGLRVFMSNLTAPALNNAQSAVGADSTRLPYGSSLLDAAISANCIGGTHQANASRSIVMVTRNLGGKEQLVVRRSINQLLANSSNNLVNPYMIPNDGVACYDSRFTNFRDVARGIGEVISPILLGRLL